MKNLFKSVLLAITAIALFSFTISGLTVILDKENGNTIKSGEVKSFNFKIKGLSTQTEVDELVAKAKAYQFVKSVSVSPNLVNGTREASASFHQSVDKSYFNKLFFKMGVETVVLGTKTMPASEFGKK